ncbi:hypothetical protein ACHQM5_004968 [Ranunculus cassubicifolius]
MKIRGSSSSSSSASLEMNHHSSFLSPLFAALDYQDTLEKRRKIDESINDSRVSVGEGESSSSMYYVPPGYRSGGTSSSEERDIGNANGSAPPVMAPYPVLSNQQGFVRYGTEVTPVFPGLNNLWSPQPVVNPYQYGSRPYNNISASGTVAPNPKQKTEDFWNSHNPQQMDNIYDHVPALHSGFAPYQAMFQNPFFSASVRGPTWNESFTSLLSKTQDPHDDYPLAPKPVRGQVLNSSPSAPCTKNEQQNVYATSQGLAEETLDGCAPISQHKRKRMDSPSYVSTTNNATTSDGNDKDDVEPSSRHATPPWLGHNAAETLVSLKSACTTIAANTYRFEEETDMEGKDWVLLVQKELRNTDVGNLGRIVLPKKDAEANLPHLIAKDGVFLQMDDMSFSTKWRFKYRYWPNNKSRMYVMENTGEFVRAHNLQTGDYFIIYKDRHSGNYIAQGKKGKKPLNNGDDERSDEDVTEKSSGSNNSNLNVNAENVSSKRKGSSRYIKRL